VAQENIVGTDSDLLFYSALWHSGKELGEFCGRKLSAIPPGMGQGTVMEGAEDAEVLRLGRQFAQSVEVDGPISIEFKRGEDGQLVMIEPNVGRSEYCVDLLVQSGFNLPHMEYILASGEKSFSTENSPRRVTWYDTERDPLGYLKDCVRNKSMQPRGTQPVFPYVGHNDPMPVIAFMVSRLSSLVTGIYRRVLRLFSSRTKFDN
jgi:predicted ATP-grasp superfamily ATP-dependent carboligase